MQNHSNQLVVGIVLHTHVLNALERKGYALLDKHMFWWATEYVPYLAEQVQSWRTRKNYR